MIVCCLVRIEYKDPPAVVYRNMSAEQYPKFLENYPDNALSKGLIVSKISIEKKLDSQEGI